MPALLPPLHLLFLLYKLGFARDAQGQKERERKILPPPLPLSFSLSLSLSPSLALTPSLSQLMPRLNPFTITFNHYLSFYLPEPCCLNRGGAASCLRSCSKLFPTGSGVHPARLKGPARKTGPGVTVPAPLICPDDDCIVLYCLLGASAHSFLCIKKEKKKKDLTLLLGLRN